LLHFVLKLTLKLDGGDSLRTPLITSLSLHPLQ
jgi:hypothetical protein